MDNLPEDDSLVCTPVPPLCLILLNLEKTKGEPLSEIEVLDARDNAACIMLPRSVKESGDEARGYRDLDLENVWEDWLGFKEWLSKE